jgi:hypothetical protein
LERKRGLVAYLRLSLRRSRFTHRYRKDTQQVASYESARLRVPASMLPRLARVLGVTLERLIGDEQRPAAKRGPTPKLQQQLERLSALPKPKQRAVMEVLEAMLAQANR